MSVFPRNGSVCSPSAAAAPREPPRPRASAGGAAASRPAPLRARPALRKCRRFLTWSPLPPEHRKPRGRDDPLSSSTEEESGVTSEQDNNIQKGQQYLNGHDSFFPRPFAPAFRGEAGDRGRDGREHPRGYDHRGLREDGHRDRAPRQSLKIIAFNTARRSLRKHPTKKHQ